MLIQPYLHRAINTLLPQDCRTCDRPLDKDPVPFFCQPCWDTISPLRGPSCPKCGRPFTSPMALRYSPYHLCGPCRRHPPSFSAAWSLYPFEGSLRDAIHLFKYQGKIQLRSHLERLLQIAWNGSPSIDLIMPVPLAPERLREREYNQALLLADFVATWQQIPLSFHHLIRTRHTPPQSQLKQAERRRNLRGAFALQQPDEIRGKTILLVDDVFTTGTTLHECSKVLRKCGSSHVYALTLARTMYH